MRFLIDEFAEPSDAKRKDDDLKGACRSTRALDHGHRKNDDGSLDRSQRET
jgi:hypothetical protein